MLTAEDDATTSLSPSRAASEQTSVIERLFI